ncbi:DNA cytosine methyltransferase [Paenibacillus tyrfis]|uniref:DNA cytosine methyltransferase n=1 Tax=Paenibacillus tyrfis TaxID=1501230 RepID=UPI0020A12DEA|nr:DNA cytosine methyltransferase [Paenibacillus tyrfis]MCP1309252.1 DNA cytosine methyltransferase [Paenibacillus tyrfis]
MARILTSLEICAGAGGQAIGLEQAGFEHLALVEIDENACNTLRTNRPSWNVVPEDLRNFSAKPFKGSIDLLAGGPPCQPFSTGGNQLGELDERNLMPEVPRLVKECSPNAIMIENVAGLMSSTFDEYRNTLTTIIEKLGYKGEWRLFNSSDFGVPQLRPRVVFVALKKKYWKHFAWPVPIPEQAPTVGDVLYEEMASNGWLGVDAWREQANVIAPTLVGGSKKHGGPDLGPTRAKRAWANLGVDGGGVANEPPSADFVGMPKLTVKMTALLQGFPEDWIITGRKTAAYRQVGNAFPPPVAKAVGAQIYKAISAAETKSINSKESKLIEQRA